MQELLSNTDILCVNETEAEGAAGALVLEEGGIPVRVCGDRLEGCVVDTTGAGDAFVGSLAYFISSHPTMSLQEKVKRSCSLASLTVLKAGTQSSYPYRAQVEHLLME